MSNNDEMDIDESLGHTQQLPNLSENLDPHTIQFVLELPKEERDELNGVWLRQLQLNKEQAGLPFFSRW